MACKPGSVPGRNRGMTIPLGRSSPNASRDLPGRRRENAPIAVPIWSCSRWGLPCRFRCRTRGALLPHHFNLAALLRRSSGRVGGIISVALSLELPPPDVIRHRVSVEPGLSSSPSCEGPAAIRPSDASDYVIARREAIAKRAAIMGSSPSRRAALPKWPRIPGPPRRRCARGANGAGTLRSPWHRPHPFRDASRSRRPADRP